MEKNFGIIGNAMAEVIASLILYSLVQVAHCQCFGQHSTATAHSITVDIYGTAYVWGRNDNGQLGDGTTLPQPSPVTLNMSGVLSAKSISVVSAYDHTILLTKDGSL